MSHKKFVDQAAGSFMTIEVSIPRWSGITQLKKGARIAAIDAGANPETFTGYVKLLGAHHSQLKQINGAFAAIRTYFYSVTLPFSQSDGDTQKRGPRLIPVCRVPEVLTRLQNMRQLAFDILDDFLPEYQRLINLAQSNDWGDWRDELSYPATEEVRRKFDCVIFPPKAIPSCDMKRFGSLPAALANRIAEDNANLLEGQLDKAKAAAMESAQDQMKTVIKQLDAGKRLHPSLISNSKRTATMLRDMTEGYDNDPRVIALADLIDEKISSVESTETWNTYPHQRAASLRAARTVEKGLADLSKPADPAPVADNKLSADSVVDTGMLADLLD